jgi:hypothetical protein
MAAFYRLALERPELEIETPARRWRELSACYVFLGVELIQCQSNHDIYACSWWWTWYVRQRWDGYQLLSACCQAPRASQWLRLVLSDSKWPCHPRTPARGSFAWYRRPPGMASGGPDMCWVGAQGWIKSGWQVAVFCPPAATKVRYTRLTQVTPGFSSFMLMVPFLQLGEVRLYSVRDTCVSQLFVDGGNCAVSKLVWIINVGLWY